MPSQRRLRLLFIIVAAGLLALFFTPRLRQASSPDADSLQSFYHKTVKAIDKARSEAQIVLDSKTGKPKGKTLLDKDADGDIDEDDQKLAKEMTDRLKAAERQAKNLANAKSPNKPDPPSNIVGVGSSAGGQAKKEKGSVANVAQADDGSNKAVQKEFEEDQQVQVELNTILRKSPVIIFSKTYCPYSKRAKGVLLEKYVIEPPPHIVELDTHPLGPQIQARLADMTGRKTVPNIMVNGKSIGGSDDIADLDRGRALVARVNALGGKRVTMKERFIEDSTAATGTRG